VPREAEKLVERMADDRSRSPDHRYDAFLSYSHSEIGLAKRLSQRIRRYRPPRRMGLSKRRLVPFRDVEQLTASNDLSDTLIERLDASRFVIVLCSPAAAGSRYVHKEVEYFLQRRDPEAIVLALCAGEADTSIPPVLRERLDEPLFVDLRPVLGRLRGYRRFRAQTLRIIAALFGVDYSKLAREDELRRRRLRVATSATALFFAAVLTSIYLVTTVPPHTWAEQALPRTGREVPSLGFANPLMPIRDIAFRRDQPTTQLYRVRDAEYHGQKPDNAVFIDPVQPDVDRDSLAAQLTRYMHAHVDPQAAPRPFARFTFSIEDDAGSIVSRGSSHFFPGGLETDGDALFYEVLALKSTQSDSTPAVQRFLISTRPMTRSTPLVNWPDQELVDRGLMPRSGIISGRFENLLDGSTTPATFRINDAMEVFRDAIGPERFDVRLGSNVADLEVDYGGSPMRLSDIDGEVEIWDQLIHSGDWVVYSPPARYELELISSRARTEDSLSQVLAGRVDDAASLVAHLVASDILEMEQVQLAIASRPTARGTLRLATLLGREEHGIAFSVGTTDRVERMILFRSPEDADWTEIRPPSTRLDSTPVDINSVDGEAMRLLLVLSGEGLAYSDDAGRTWQDFNLGETRLASDGEIQVIPAGDPASIYVLVDNELEGDGSRQNYLFRLDRRDWRDRLRLALVNWLQK
jgi:TIR domain